MPTIDVPKEAKLPTHVCANCCSDEGITEAKARFRNTLSSADENGRTFEVVELPYGICEVCRPNIHRSPPTWKRPVLLFIVSVLIISALTFGTFFSHDMQVPPSALLLPLVFGTLVTLMLLKLTQVSPERGVTPYAPVLVTRVAGEIAKVSVANAEYAELAKAALS